MRRLERAFYERDTVVVAAELIGKILNLKQGTHLLSGIIVETEAYLGSEDPASHAHRGVTPRNRVMFGPAGFSYVYFTYGNHHCFNVVTESEHKPGAVLIRALEPLGGIDEMKKRRHVLALEDVASGPGKLTQAFGMTREHSGLDLTTSDLFLTEAQPNGTLRIKTSKRIGISRAKELPYRFYLLGNLCVSKT